MEEELHLEIMHHLRKHLPERLVYHQKHLLFNISYEFCLEENFMLVDITCIAAFFVGSPHQELHPLDLKMGVTAFLNEVCIYCTRLVNYLNKFYYMLLSLLGIVAHFVG